tara:strand:+ start:2130 stop:2498 length:369 start_codon:yes stop_codon:yes gene_type:complete
MESLLLPAAAVVAFAGALFHGYVGGKIYMGHINASDLMPLTQSLSLVSWHMFTVFLLVSGATLICVAMKPDLALLSYPILLANALGAVLFLLLGVAGHGRLLKLPGLYLMSMTALLGWLGVS